MSDELEALLPSHKASLHLTHNEHKTNYESVEDYTEWMELDSSEWVSEKERKATIERDSIWVLQWYPDTPIGFHRLVASTLNAIIEKLKSGTEA